MTSSAILFRKGNKRLIGKDYSGALIDLTKDLNIDSKNSFIYNNLVDTQQFQEIK